MKFWCLHPFLECAFTQTCAHLHNHMCAHKHNHTHMCVARNSYVPACTPSVIPKPDMASRAAALSEVRRAATTVRPERRSWAWFVIIVVAKQTCTGRNTKQHRQTFAPCVRNKKGVSFNQLCESELLKIQHLSPSCTHTCCTVSRPVRPVAPMTSTAFFRGGGGAFPSDILLPSALGEEERFSCMLSF